MPPSGVTCSAPSSPLSYARSWTSAAARRACGPSGATCCATSTVCSTPPSKVPARHGLCAHRPRAVPQASCRPPASLCHPGSRRPRHRKPAPSRPPHPSAAAGRGVVPRAPEFPKFLHSIRYLALSGVQVEPQATGHEIVQDRPPGCLALPAHVLDREEHFLSIPAHAKHDKQRDRGRLAVEPHPHHCPVEDEADDRLGRQVAPGPGIPVALHLAPHPADHVFADRAPE